MVILKKAFIILLILSTSLVLGACSENQAKETVVDKQISNRPKPSPDSNKLTLVKVSQTNADALRFAKADFDQLEEDQFLNYIRDIKIAELMGQISTLESVRAQ